MLYRTFVPDRPINSNSYKIFRSDVLRLGDAVSRHWMEKVEELRDYPPEWTLQNSLIIQCRFNSVLSDALITSSDIYETSHALTMNGRKARLKLPS